MERGNWNELRSSDECPDFRPSVVKVSHHGSSTGRIDGMWGPEGFLGRHAPIAVITPWYARLPEQTVIDEILSGGSQVYITGRQHRFRTEDRLSHVHVRVHTDGRAEIVSKSPSVVRYEQRG